MIKMIRLITGMSLAATLICGCAVQPTAAVSAVAPAVKASSTSDHSAAATGVNDNNAVDPETYKKAKALGYQARVRNGVTVFCHNDAVIGTRFPTERCVRADSIDAEAEMAAQMRQRASQPRACSGAGCSTN